MSQGHILFIDAYDSFSNNIIALLKSELLVSVETIKIDDPRFVLNDDAFRRYLAGFEAVVAGPGPGHPATASDVGLIRRLWDLQDEALIPALGICLGFQSLALAFGATVERLREPRHGMVTPLLHCGTDIFEDTGKVLATQYHSLHITLASHREACSVDHLWRPSQSCKEVLPLAWDLSDERNGAILMALRHCHKPFWAVQYHPESICTNAEGKKVVTNWWREACAWHAANSRLKHCINGFHTGEVSQSRDRNQAAGKLLKITVEWKSLRVQNQLDIADVTNLFRKTCSRHEPILLESGTRNGKPVNEETGGFSILGLLDEKSIHIRYSVKNNKLTISTTSCILASWKSNVADAFEFLKTFIEQHKAEGGSQGVPFWAGLIGFASYEAGLETIDVEPAESSGAHPDMWFVFVERSIVLDRITGKLYLQTIRDGDSRWLSTAEQELQHLTLLEQSIPATFKHDQVLGDVVSSPKENEYCCKVETCQGHLRAGSSYELCLTDTTSTRCNAEPWSLYLRLRKLNPAPFGAYFSMAATSPEHGSGSSTLSLLSSSPERFLSWSRDGRCQFRPIKGTVKKCLGMTRKKAERILKSPKEQAENLMIVDLIRHDLNGVEGASNVRVPKLMSVEEYESVFQLVSVIEGEIEGSGLPVLAASLPPGSMTGAPKKRSCELLQEIEGGKARGLYSGVFGYLDVGGGGDFSVVIRSAFQWNDEEWWIGAGGAITALSDPKAEWDEMLAKRENVLRAFL